MNETKSQMYFTTEPYPYLYQSIQPQSFVFQMYTLYVAWVDTAILVLTKISIYFLKDIWGKCLHRTKVYVSLALRALSIIAKLLIGNPHMFQVSVVE